MKYALIVGDGMADLPIPELSGQTPLAFLASKGMAEIAGGQIGRFMSCPAPLPPGSDVAFLSLLGNDPRTEYTGRSPLEAAGMGIDLHPGETAFRMNLVSITDEGYPDARLLSHNGGGIEGEDARRLALDLVGDAPFSALLRECGMTVYETDTFRHIAVMKSAYDDCALTPPHDLAGRQVSCGLPADHRLLRLMKASFAALNAHPINEKRRAAGLLPANSAWFWGAGTACALPSFSDKYGVKGAVISAVPLVKGIARMNGLSVIDVPGATGLLDTDYAGKVSAALFALDSGHDFVLVHLEAPDEMSHDGDLPGKLEAIRRLDARIIQPLLEGLRAYPEYRVLLMSDHYTLLSTRTHDATPVPFAIRDSRHPGTPRAFTESLCENAPLTETGDELLRLFLQRKG